MKEFVKRLIGRLEEEREISYADFYEYLMKYELYNDFDEDDDWFYKGLIRAISIVNQLAEEYKGKDCSKCSRRSWYQKGYKDAEKELAEEYNNGWIACEKELPKEGTYVLTCDKAGHIFLEIWGGCYTVNHYPTTKFGFDNETIIAWMPLPAPYQKGE